MLISIIFLVKNFLDNIKKRPRKSSLVWIKVVQYEIHVHVSFHTTYLYFFFWRKCQQNFQKGLLGCSQNRWVYSFLIVFYSSSLFFYLHISQLNVHNILLNDITKTSHKHSSFYLTYLAKASWSVSSPPQTQFPGFGRPHQLSDTGGSYTWSLVYSIKSSVEVGH